QNLVGSATRGEHRLMVVIYNSDDRYSDARKVLDNGFGGYAWFRTDQYFPFTVPFTVLNAGDVLLPAWERPQIQLFVDPDASVAHFTLVTRELVSAPVTGIAAAS